MTETVDNRRHWHLDKGINPVYVTALATAILGGLAWAGWVNSGQAVQDQKIGTVEKRVEDFTKANREDLLEINRKLDRLLERGKP